MKVANRQREEAQKLIASAQRDLDLMKDNPVEYKLESALRRKKIAEENRERFDKAWIRIREYFEDENFKLQS